jgi:hypothetical protein
VQQLKNRVRMLQEEESRALRQIHETRLKSFKIREAMQAKDQKVKCLVEFKEKQRERQEELKEFVKRQKARSANIFKERVKRI